ncbi:MAG: nuclease A inhibitor family protein [Myxococcota bacterium]
MRALVFISGLILITSAACADGGDDAGLATVDASLADGSPQAVGLLGFLNDVKTTVAVLDLDVGLDVRAAQALVAHRDGKDGKNGTKDDDRFDTVAEVDAVSWVGTSAFDKLLSYCAGHGWLPQGNDVLGSYDSVSFTVEQATATLALANTATQTHLDKDLGMNSRAVTSIIAARPIASVLALSQLPNVGTTALRILLQAATAPVVPQRPAGVDVAAHLGVASAGLEHTSESDYPFVVVRIPGAGGAPITAANVKTLIAGVYVNRPDEEPLATRTVEVGTLQSFFDRYTIPQDWWEDFQTQQAPAWTALEGVFQKELIEVKVFRLGRKVGNYLEGAIDVYIIGRTIDGELVGLSTISIET